MPTVRHDDVDDYLAASRHGRMAEVRAIRVALRAALRTARPPLTERVKWNAPSFAIEGRDRVTFRLHPGDRVQLVLHLGARTGDGVAEIAGPEPSAVDPNGLARWVTSERGIVTFRDAADVEERLEDVVALVVRWVTATT